MKKNVMVFILALMAFGLVAQDQGLSLGFSTGYAADLQAHSGSDDTVYYEGAHLLSFGTYLDTVFVQAGIDYLVSVGEVSTKTKVGGDLTFDGSRDIRTSYINLNLLLKYPVALGSAITLYPALGATYRVNLTYEDQTWGVTKEDLSDNERAELNDFIVNFGLLGDLNLGENFYLRSSVLLGVNLTTEREFYKDIVELAGGDYSTLGLVPSVSVGVGFRL